MPSINLSNREAAKLLRSWGFVAVGSGRSTGGHAFFAWQDANGPRVAITSPGRKTVTPPVAYEKAAQIVGVSVRDLLAGPPNRKKPIVTVSETVPAPSTPLVQESIVSASTSSPTPPPFTVSTPLSPSTETVLEQAYDLFAAHGPLTPYEIGQHLGLESAKVRVALRDGLAAGLVHRRQVERQEIEGAGTGLRPFLYFHTEPIPGRETLILRQPTVRAFTPATTPPASTPPTPKRGRKTVTEALPGQVINFTYLRTQPDGSLVLLDSAYQVFVARVAAL